MNLGGTNDKGNSLMDWWEDSFRSSTSSTVDTGSVGVTQDYDLVRLLSPYFDHPSNGYNQRKEQILSGKYEDEREVL